LPWWFACALCETAEVLGVGEVAVAVVASLIVGGLLAVVIYLFWRLLRKTTQVVSANAPSSWFMWIGVAIAVFGVTDLIWTQATGLDGFGHLGAPSSIRWQLAEGPITVIALGLILAVAAQILAAVQVRRQ
jgi:hypothetical protein